MLPIYCRKAFLANGEGRLANALTLFFAGSARSLTS
jgi:hypothetical protein